MRNQTLISIEKIILLFFPFIYLLGLIGNILSFIIFSKKKFKNTIFDVYFRSLNILYSIMLQYVVIDLLKYRFDINLELKSKISCKFLNYIYFTFAPIGSWTLVVISIDRMLNVVYPFKFKTLKESKLFQFGIIVFLIIFNHAYYIRLIFRAQYFSLISNQTNSLNNLTTLSWECEIKDEGVTYWMDLFNSTLIPFLLMITFSTITIHNLFKLKLNVSQSLSKRDKRFAIISISQNITFLILNIPIVIYYLFTLYFHLDKLSIDFFYIIAIIPYYIQCGIIFYINCSINPVFRNEFFQIVSKFIFRSTK
jgi:hypothetical protein